MLLSDFDTFKASGGISEATIAEVEATIGFVLPDEFRFFLSQFGTLQVGSESILGLGGPQHEDLLKNYRSFLEWKPTSFLLLPICADGFGNYHCIDLRSPDRDHRPVVFFRHDDPDDLTPEVIASSFDAWFKTIIEEANE